MEKEKKEFLQKEQDLKAEIEKLCEKGRRYFRVAASSLFGKLVLKGAAGHRSRGTAWRGVALHIGPHFPAGLLSWETHEPLWKLPR